MKHTAFCLMRHFYFYDIYQLCGAENGMEVEIVFCDHLFILSRSRSTKQQWYSKLKVYCLYFKGVYMCVQSTRDEKCKSEKKNSLDKDDGTVKIAMSMKNRITIALKEWQQHLR